MKLEDKFKLKSQLFDWTYVKRDYYGKDKDRDPKQWLTVEDKKYFVEEGEESDVYIFHINDRITVQAKDKNKDAFDSLKALQTARKKHFG